MAPAALSLLTVAFPAGRQRDVAMGVWGGLAGLGGTAEVVLGGLLVDTLSWRWVFLVNVPVVALLVALSRVVLTESREQVEGTAPVDWRGGVLGTAGLLAVMLGVIDSGAHGWGSTRVLGELVGGAAVLAAFLAVERRAPRPLLPLPLLWNRGLALGSLMLSLNGATFLATSFLTATALQTVRHDTAVATGVAFLRMGVAAIIAAVAAGRLVTQLGTRRLQGAGTVLSLAGLLLLASSDPTGDYATSLLPGLVLFGAGIVTIGVPTQVGADTAGTVSGVLTAAYQVGSALGLAAISTVATSRVADQLAQGHASGAALTSGCHLGLTVAAGLAVLNAGLVWRSPSVREVARAEISTPRARP